MKSYNEFREFLAELGLHEMQQQSILNAMMEGIQVEVDVTEEFLFRIKVYADYYASRNRRNCTYGESV